MDDGRPAESGSVRRTRGLWAAAAGGALLALALGARPAGAQVYTRKNANGVVEATNVPASRDFRLTYPGKGRVIHSAAYRMRPSYNGEFNHHIAAASSLYGVSVDLVRAIIQVESDFDHLARSSKGAQGLMQLMPDTARLVGVSNAFDPRQNIFGGVRYLRQMLDQFRGDIALAAAAYNAGPNAVARYNGVPPYKETRDYVDKVQSLLGMAPTPLLVTAREAAAFFTPSPGGFLRPAAAPASQRPGSKAHARPGRLQPARPRVFYKWTDAQGVMHVGQNPPSEGVVYSMIRALD